MFSLHPIILVAFLSSPVDPMFHSLSELVQRSYSCLYPVRLARSYRCHSQWYQCYEHRVSYIRELHLPIFHGAVSRCLMLRFFSYIQSELLLVSRAICNIRYLPAWTFQTSFPTKFGATIPINLPPADTELRETGLLNLVTRVFVFISRSYFFPQ